MGKGDQRSKKGKIIAGTYGVSRPKKKVKVAPAPKKKAAKKPAAKKTTAKKAAPKKAAE